MAYVHEIPPKPATRKFVVELDETEFLFLRALLGAFNVVDDVFDEDGNLLITSKKYDVLYDGFTSGALALYGGWSFPSISAVCFYDDKD